MIGATSAANVGVESAEITYVPTETQRTPRTAAERILLEKILCVFLGVLCASVAT